ncbi:MAG: two-component sensor histidine kinase, partial [Phycisphaeraceae bacterium]|nr:two-component sensor histidine kinase [Phycisphaeraceae bacterium]
MLSDSDRDRLASLGQLASGLAHEIKNPLSTMNINLQLLEEDWREARDEREVRGRRRLEILGREVKRLEEIVNDFLRYARRRELDRRPHQVNRILGEVLDFTGPALDRAGVRVRRLFAEDLPPLAIDRDQFKQAILNLVVNAQQAMPDGGELMVRTGTLSGEVRIEITDTGEGIPPQVLERMWDVYFSSKKTGTGMGLPTARRLIQEHD